MTDASVHHSEITIPSKLSKRRTELKLKEHINGSIDDDNKCEYAEVTDICNKLFHEERKLKEHLDELLNQSLVVKERKSCLLLNRWHKNVYNPLCEKIKDEMAIEKFKIFNAKKRHQYEKYLKQGNCKGHVCLDVYDVDEYDPLLLNRIRPGPVKVGIGKLSDSLFYSRNTSLKENLISPSSDHVVEEVCNQINTFPPISSAPLQRMEYSCNTWQGIELRNIESEARKRSQ